MAAWVPWGICLASKAGETLSYGLAVQASEPTNRICNQAGSVCSINSPFRLFSAFQAISSSNTHVGKEHTDILLNKKAVWL